MPYLRIGTGEDILSKAYTDSVVEILKRKCRKIKIRLCNIKYDDNADKDIDKNKSLLRAVADKKIDACICDVAMLNECFKDEDNTELMNNVEVVAVVKEYDSREVLVTRKWEKWTFDHPYVECHNRSSANQLSKIYDGVKCVVTDNEPSTQLDRLSKKMCDAVVLAALDVRILKKARVHGFKYKGFDTHFIVPQTGQGLKAIVMYKNNPYQKEVVKINDIIAAKRLCIEQAVLEKIDMMAVNTLFLKDGKNPIIVVNARIERAKLTLSSYVRLNCEKTFVVKVNVNEWSNAVNLISNQINEYIQNY